MVIFVTYIDQHSYCRANQEWQWRNIMFTIVVMITLYTPLELPESIDHVCTNPIRMKGLIHKWYIDSKSW